MNAACIGVIAVGLFAALIRRIGGHIIASETCACSDQSIRLLSRVKQIFVGQMHHWGACPIHDAARGLLQGFMWVFEVLLASQLPPELRGQTSLGKRSRDRLDDIAADLGRFRQRAVIH